MCPLAARGEETKIKPQISKTCNCCPANSRNQYAKIPGFLTVKKKKKMVPSKQRFWETHRCHTNKKK
jgi:hypothetical protein